MKLTNEQFKYYYTKSGNQGLNVSTTACYEICKYETNEKKLSVVNRIINEYLSIQVQKDETVLIINKIPSKLEETLIDVSRKAKTKFLAEQQAKKDEEVSNLISMLKE